MTEHPITAAMLETHIGILGKTGSGKTVAAKGMAEGILDRGERICVVDPTGVWWGLRLKRDGVTPAYPVVIFGGRHGDVPIGKDSGARLAQIIGRDNVPAIIDTRTMTVNARTAFFTEFAQALMRENTDALHLFIDEAHVFAPKGKVASLQSAGMLNAANELVSGGRSMGLRITLISQRPAKLHNDSLSQVETLVAMRLVAPHDRRAVGEWMNEHDGVKTRASLVDNALPRLKRGEGFVWAPEFEIMDKYQFPMCETFDSSAAPKPGDKPRKPRAMSDAEIGSMRALLETVEPTGARAAGKAPAPAPDTSRLEAELARVRADRDAENAKAYQAGVRHGEHTMRTRMVEWLTTVQLDGVTTESQAKRQAHPGRDMKITIKADRPFTTGQSYEIANPPASIAVTTERTPGFLPTQEISARDMAKKYPPATPPKAAREPAVAGDADARILAVLQAGPLPWADVAILAGYAESGGGFRAARKRITESGAVHLVEGTNEVVLATMKGPRPALPGPDAVVAMWCAKLPSTPATLLRAAFEAGGSLTVTELAAATGYAATGGGFRTALKKLRTTGLVRQNLRAIEMNPAFWAGAQS
jgi:hypothetical protein